MYKLSGVLHKVEVTNDRQRSLTGGISRRTWVRIPPLQQNILRDRAEAARKAHNLEVGGSNPPPATKPVLTLRFTGGQFSGAEDWVTPVTALKVCTDTVWVLPCKASLLLINTN